MVIKRVDLPTALLEHMNASGNAYGGFAAISLAAVFPSLPSKAREHKAIEYFKRGVFSAPKLTADGAYCGDSLELLVYLVLSAPDLGLPLYDEVVPKLEATKEASHWKHVSSGTALAPAHLPGHARIPWSRAASALLGWARDVNSSDPVTLMIREIITESRPAAITRAAMEVLKNRTSTKGGTAAFRDRLFAAAALDSWPYPLESGGRVAVLPIATPNADSKTFKRALKHVSTLDEDTRRVAFSMMSRAPTIEEIAAAPNPISLCLNLPWELLGPIVDAYPIELNNCLLKGGIDGVDVDALQRCLKPGIRRPPWRMGNGGGVRGWLASGNMLWLASQRERLERAAIYASVWEALRNREDIIPVKRWAIAEHILGKNEDLGRLLSLDPECVDVRNDCGDPL